MRHAFWHSAKILLSYKRLLAGGFAGALVSAGCFGAGIGLIYPTLVFLLQKQESVTKLISEKMIAPERSPLVQAIGRWLVTWVPSDPFGAFLLVMGVIAVLAVIGSVGRYCHQLITITVAERSVMAWRNRMFRRLIRAPLELLLQTGSADHIGRVVFDARPLGAAYQAILGKTVEQLLKGLAAVALAFWFDPWLTLIALLGAPPIVILLRKFGKRIRRATKRALQQRGRMVGSLKEAMDGIRVVKVHNAEGYERRRFGMINRKLFAEQMKIRSVRALASPVVETMGLFGVIAVASIAAFYIFQRDMSAEQFMSVLLWLALAAGSVRPLAKLNSVLNEGRAAAERMFELLAMDAEPTGPDARHDLADLPRHHQSIAFCDVTFAYPGQMDPAVDHLSLSIAHGQTIALVGPNGSGKSTLLSMLPRLLAPQAGRIEIDGIDIADIRLRNLRQQMAVVPQQTVLFEGTIAQNIAYGRRHAARESIVAAARTAFADEFISAMPRGYDTILAEQGEGLSGGQRQRIAIARAILRNPAILILDEATSQIDAESEAKINDALRDFRHGRTVLVIAHRLSTVIDADRIVVLDAGRIVDQGKHDELLQRCDVYGMLAQTQLRSAVGV